MKERGYFVGIAGNQTARAGHLLRELHLPCDVIATSDDWGAEKPSAEFFGKLVVTCGRAAEQIAYVGDHLDNDLGPARTAGLTHVAIRRGPWAYILGQELLDSSAPLVIGSLDQLPAALL